MDRSRACGWGDDVIWDDRTVRVIGRGAGELPAGLESGTVSWRAYDMMVTRPYLGPPPRPPSQLTYPGLAPSGGPNHLIATAVHLTNRNVPGVHRVIRSQLVPGACLRACTVYPISHRDGPAASCL
ncbi:hypothetical protein BO94DRAFT_236857 [Aspergillus sclerotioniger CBS 115572]|uniref:Uncharacterized protein n=1 Tax=Aspergillus sclerotioniger CBS 115572 TaxID=1450535 RepID=A0A317VL30_9EURO|nr:hypothetical protein BO94DRAFT_236857 [Aspergillus sclerotioniger CBS 115572]PWY73837.1 hypothetical protein BO94DRAFT_236857 [Aspergillus sclerotioniger CBS 115572]